MKSILIVDDEPNVSRVTRHCLERAGYEVEIAPDGVEAMERLQWREFDAVVTDVMMPRVKGTELATWMRERRPETALLLVSGYMDSKKIQEWVDQDPDVFLAKPFEPEELLERVRMRLSRR